MIAAPPEELGPLSSCDGKVFKQKDEYKVKSTHVPHAVKSELEIRHKEGRGTVKRGSIDTRTKGSIPTKESKPSTTSGGDKARWSDLL